MNPHIRFVWRVGVLSLVACLLSPLACADGVGVFKACADGVGAFKAGFARVDVSPAVGTPMSGYFHRRVMVGVLDPIEANCLAVCDGTNTGFVIAVDNLHLNDDVIAESRAAIGRLTGVPPEAIYIHSTHIHTGPDVNRDTGLSNAFHSADDLEAIRAYVRFLVSRLGDVAKYSQDDLSPATLRIGRSECPRHAFIRRYLMKDGSVRTNPGVDNPDIVRPVGTSDDTVQIARFMRERKCEITLVNFQNHPDCIGGNRLSADWPGKARRTIETALEGKVRCFVLNGAQGDVNHVIYRPTPGEKLAKKGYENAMNMGIKLAGAVLNGLGRCDPVETGMLRYGAVEVSTPANLPRPEEIPLARKYWDLAVAGKYDEIPGVGMARTTVIADARRKLRLEHGPASFNLPVSAFAIGSSLAFVGLPGEPFVAIGREIKGKSRFRMTMVTCLTNGSRGYFPTGDAFAGGSYESATSDFTERVGPNLVAGAVALLERLHPDAACWRSAGARGLADFEVLRENGAEGDVAVSADGTIHIRKANDVGAIHVIPREPVAVASRRSVRASATCFSTNAIPLESFGTVGFWTEKGFSRSDRNLEGSSLGATVKLFHLVNKSVTKMAYRTIPTNSTPVVRPAISVWGAASDTVWKDWQVEDLARFQSAYRAAHPAKALPPDMPRLNEVDFRRQLAAEPDHSARVANADGESRLYVDGQCALPVFYKDCARVNRYRAAGLAEAGATLLAVSLDLAGRAGRPGPWTKDGFDAGAAADTISQMMRCVPNALFFVSLNLSPYPEMCERYPDETWVTEEGFRVVGSGGVARVLRPDEALRKDEHPWMSYFSPAWRRDVKGVLAALVAELRMRGYLRKVVGFHLSGGYDGQFATAFSDCSKSARDGYAVWKRTVSRPGAPLDYSAYLKRAPIAMLDDLARALKNEVGKDVVVFKWCMSPFGTHGGGAFDIADALESAAIDFVVPQPTYCFREEGYPLSVRLPTASFHRHGKMVVSEFDFRTFLTYDHLYGEMHEIGASKAQTIESWRAIHRRAAGSMLARGSGWWYFDMAGNWFQDAGILADVREVMAVANRLKNRPPCAWHPSLALLIDEDGILRQPADGRVDVGSVLMRLAAAGVPYDAFLASDWANAPERAKGYRALIACGVDWMHPSRRVLGERLDGMGLRRLDAGHETPRSVYAFARDAGVYVPTRFGLQVDANGDFMSVHALIPGTYDITLPWGKGATVVLATGETHWFERL